MFFKNLTVFATQPGWLPSAEQLARGAFLPCASIEMSSRGWIAPRGDGDLLPIINGQALLALQIEQRLLPSSVVNREVQRIAKEMEEQQGYAPGRKQRRELKERVTAELMAKAFTTQKVVRVWIDPINGTLAIDTASPSMSDAVLEHLRYSLDEFPVFRLDTKVAPQAAMADWLAGGDAPEGFTIDQDCKLTAIDEGKATVSYQRCHLEHDEVMAHLASGKLPTKLAMTFNDRVSFVLNEKMALTRINLLDIAKDTGQDAQSADELFDIDFTIMAGEYGQLINAVVQALGGPVPQEKKDGE